MTDNEKNEIALLRYGVIAELVSGTTKCSSKKAYFIEKAENQIFTINSKPIKVSAQTIERWYLTYKKKGFEGLKPKNRSDSGRPRKIDDEIIMVIKQYVTNHPRMPSTLIYDELLHNNYITSNEISLSTITRCVNSIKTKEEITNNIEMRRYEAEHINDIWCCDTTYSFKLTVNGEKKRMFIIAIIDDASRMIVGIDVFFNDNYVNFMSVLKKAVTNYGKPKTLNLDNGAPYKNKQLELLAARLGICLFHNRPYFGEGKAKIERWFRTMKDHFMASYHLTAKTTIDEFKNDLFKYVNDYNNQIHSSLNNMSPSTRFFDSGDEIIRLDDNKIEESFLLEIDRKVSADNVIQIDNIEFEVPYIYSNKKIKIRYSADYSKCYVVNPNNDLKEIKLLDKVANSKAKREKPKFNTEDN